ncbi:nucleotidyltransferase domain-containing protein [Allorhizobium pseudoryzae]|uniref:nucleotidyltransferase domain-containing protein n=1 Tax=Allorhizobium pseudoryzae TaxID=379684 RepID=UPI003D079D4B
MQITPAQSACIVSWAENIPFLKRVFLTGSRSRRAAHAASDIDLGLEFYNEESDEWLVHYINNRQAWTTELSGQCGFPVELHLWEPGQLVYDNGAADAKLLYFDSSSEK